MVVARNERSVFEIDSNYMERSDPRDRQTLTPTELAHEIGKAPKTVRRYLRRGYIKAVKLGGKWRISKADANAWWRERGGGLLFPEAGVGEVPADGGKDDE